MEGWSAQRLILGSISGFRALRGFPEALRDAHQGGAQFGGSSGRGRAVGHDQLAHVLLVLCDSVGAAGRLHLGFRVTVWAQAGLWP